ncbi:MAG: hypothetical protein A4S08_08515 [Proteobacteria bacterium SG_bin4]|nr:MAG: hypothetical protein A4S08_08515 [Proteobacteria bacterium SG_bin4]
MKQNEKSGNIQRPLQGKSISLPHLNILASDINNSSRMLAQRKLKNLILNSPRRVMQQQLNHRIHDNSPMTVQSQQAGIKESKTQPLSPTTGVAQAKRYTVTRDLPLTTVMRPIDVGSAKSRLLSNLRSDYPIPKGVSIKDEMSGDERDQFRGEEFLRKKVELLKKLPETGTVPVPSAHVANIATHERLRAKNSQAKAISQIAPKIDWIGAHLVKREWGGEDNMWNVVAWPQRAEDTWAEKFEDPIDIAISNQTAQDVNISLSVIKEDEIVSKDAAILAAQEKIKGLKDDGQKENWAKLISEEAAKSRWDVNRAVESVPIEANGSSRLGAVRLDQALTQWNDAEKAGYQAFTNTVERAAAKAPNEKRAPFLKGGDEMEKIKHLERNKERKEAWEQEKANYTETHYERFSNIEGTE